MHKAVILDRDGVINDNSENVNVNTPAQLVLFDFAANAIESLNRAGFCVVVATNQGGVGLGFMSKDRLAQIHEYMVSELEKQGAKVSDIAACTHKPRAGCACRKPRPGLLFELRDRNALDLSKSYMLGDRETDVEAGKAAGTKTVFIGDGPSEADHTAPNLLEAAAWIIADDGTRS